MPTEPKKAVARHRERQKRKGLVRVEVQVPKEDAARLRALSEALRTPETAAAVRAELERIIGSPLGAVSFKELLASAPLEGVDLDRRRELPRDVDL